MSTKLLTGKFTKTTLFKTESFFFYFDYEKKEKIEILNKKKISMPY